jgi:hypothetical protein
VKSSVKLLVALSNRLSYSSLGRMFILESACSTDAKAVLSADRWRRFRRGPGGLAGWGGASVLFLLCFCSCFLDREKNLAMVMVARAVVHRFQRWREKCKIRMARKRK